MRANKREDFAVNTIIGPNTCLNGDVNSFGFTRVDGSLRGNLTAAGRIIVGEQARMKSCITGPAITIGGVVFGNVLASERVTILATGIVLGDIITQRIQADEGCLIHGRITVCQTREKWDNAISEYHDRENIESVTAGFAPRPNSAASGVSPAGFLPENAAPENVPLLLEFPAGNTPLTTGWAAFLESTPPAPENAVPENTPLSPETFPFAGETETISPEPKANLTPVFGYTALPAKTFFAGEQTTPESSAGESPPENAAPESASLLPEFSAKNTPLTIDWAAFSENTPSAPENAASESASLLPEFSAKNTPLRTGWAAFSENTPSAPENAASESATL
jgi:cytoskeletal protein CcmA (bactofilin family)